MNAALLAPELFSSEGGLSRILRLYLKALCELADAGDEVRLVTLIDPNLPKESLRKYAGARLVESYACGRNKLRFVWHTFRVARHSKLLICGHIGQLPVAWLASKLYPDLRYILVAHGLEVWRSFGPIERAALRGTSSIWCVSEFTRGQLLQHSGLTSNRAVVFSNALDPFFEFLVGKEEPNTPIILTISRLSWSDRYKGVDHLIEALSRVRSSLPNAILRVVGSGDDLERLKAIAVENGIADAVQFLGYLPDVAMKQELSSCRIFALASEREGFGLVYLEAMAQGRPCVGANAGGTPEVIDASSGILCKFGDVESLAAALIEALHRPWDRSAIRARAELFSYRHFRDRLRELLRDNSNPVSNAAIAKISL